MAYIGRVPPPAPLTSADIPNGIITNDDLASGVAVANIGYTPENPSNKNAANGYAGLDSSGKVAAAQLPSYVDDVVEYSNLAAFPGTGETAKIYVALDTNKTYRWSGSAYVEISASPGSTDSLTEGSVNLYYTNARAREAVSATQNLTYNSATGVFTGPDLSGYLQASAIGTTVQAYDADLNTWSTKTAPTGTVVGTTDAQTLSAKTITGLKETKVAMAANDIDLSAGNWFTKTISAATTLTVSNVPTTGTASSFILDLTNGGAGTITWWTGMKWVGGTAPTLTASGRDALGFFTHDGGTTWSGFVLGKDVK